MSRSLLQIEFLTTGSFPLDNFSSVYWIFTKLGNMIHLWKGKNPIYFGVITIIPFDNLYRRAYFVMHTFLVLSMISSLWDTPDFNRSLLLPKASRLHLVNHLYILFRQYCWYLVLWLPLIVNDLYLFSGSAVDTWTCTYILLWTIYIFFRQCCWYLDLYLPLIVNQLNL